MHGITHLPIPSGFHGVLQQGRNCVNTNTLMQPTQCRCSKILGELYRLKLLHGAGVFAVLPHDLAFSLCDF
jgi:hypothetical protein